MVTSSDTTVTLLTVVDVLCSALALVIPPAWIALCKETLLAYENQEGEDLKGDVLKIAPFKADLAAFLELRAKYITSAMSDLCRLDGLLAPLGLQDIPRTFDFMMGSVKPMLDMDQEISELPRVTNAWYDVFADIKV